MTNAMPDRRVPIKDAAGKEIGEVTEAEFDVETQTIVFSGQLDSGMNFKASQIVGLSFGSHGFTAVEKETDD